MARTLTLSTCKHMLLLVALFLLPLAAKAWFIDPGSGLYFERMNNSGLAVVIANPSGNKYKGDITIPGLTTDFYAGGYTYLVTSIADEAFKDCTELTSINMAGMNPALSIGNRTFLGCSNLKTVILPMNGTYSIGSLVFGKCSGLTSLTIPGSVTSIGDYAFAYCQGLKEIYCEAVTPPDSEGEPFYNVETSKVLLVVPDGSLAQYKAHDVWKQFWIETPTGISLTPDISKGGETIYDLSGKRLQKMQRGINIVGGKKVAVK